MDLSFVKQKLEANANKGAGREKIDYTKIFWKPKAGKYQIRILPNKFRKEWPLREVQMHYGFSKGPILALSNWGEEDPITDFAKKLRQSSLSADLRSFLAKSVIGSSSPQLDKAKIGPLENP